MSKMFTTTITELEDNKAQIDVELSADTSKQMFDGVSNQLSKQHKIEGFRPGHAPFGIVSQKLGAEFVMQKVIDRAFQKTYLDVIKEAKQEFWGVPEISVQKIAFGNPIVYRLVVHKRPEIMLPDLKKIKVNSEKQKIGGKEFNEALEQLQKSRAQFVTVSRAAKKTDRVEIDFSATHDGKPVEGSDAKNYPLIIGESQMVPGFDDHVVGMKAGEEKTFTIDMPKQGIIEAIAGKKINFKAKVHVVQERTLPELNDEFAQGLGDFKTMKDMEEAIKTGMLAEKEKHETERRRIAILDALHDKVKIEIPDVILDKEIEHELNHMRNDLTTRGMDWQMYLKQINKTEDDLKKTIRPQAQKRIGHSLIMDSIAKTQKIEISDSDVGRELEAFRSARQAQGQAEALDEDQVEDQIRRGMRNRKIFEYLEKSVTITNK